MAELNAKQVDIRDQIANRTHQWLRGLNVDPVALREKRGMKGKKHFVELLVAYRDLFRFYESTGNTAEKQRVVEDARHVLTAVHDSAYHDLNRCGNEQFSQDALSYLLACDLANFFGEDTKQYLAEIIQILPRIYSHVATRGACQRMAFVRRLKALGLLASETVEQLVGGTIIRQRKNFAKVQRIDAYLMVHEVLHITDNGRYPERSLNSEDRDYLRSLFQGLIDGLKSDEGLDLLAEVLFAMACLGMNGSAEWRAAVQYIRDRQNANGSFGAYEENRKSGEISGSPYDVDVGMYLHTTAMCMRTAILSD